MEKHAEGDAALAFSLLEESVDNPDVKLAYRAQSISLSLPIMLRALSESGVSIGIQPAELPKFSKNTPNIYQEFFYTAADGSYYGLNPKVARIVGEYNKCKGIEPVSSFSYQTLKSISSYTPEILMSEIIYRDIKIPKELFWSMPTK